MASETLIQVEAAEAAFWLSNLLSELYCQNTAVKIHCYTDSRQLYEAVNSLKPIVDRRLRIDLSILKEMLERKEISEIRWIDSQKQLANCLTKKGASAVNLLTSLRSGKLH